MERDYNSQILSRKEREWSYYAQILGPEEREWGHNAQMLSPKGLGNGYNTQILGHKEKDWVIAHRYWVKKGWGEVTRHRCWVLKRSRVYSAQV